MMLFDFIAIDFETANANYSSACSLGLVAVKEKNIVETKYFLIQPPDLDFDERNINIHGITPEKVKDSPLFPEVWNEIKDYFKDNVIVAHNAVFDMSVLKSCLLEYNLDIPDFNYLCSIPLSTRACRGEGVGQSLKDRANRFGVKLENHHNALADAVTCAKIVIECINLKKRKSFQSYCKTFTSLPIKNFSELKPQTRFKKASSNKFNRINISEIACTESKLEKSHVFYGKNIVFTGELVSLSRKEAMQKVVNFGGILKSGVSTKTDYLIVGIQDKSIVGEKGMSSKEVKAYELQAKGHNIKVLSEDDFIKCL